MAGTGACWIRASGARRRPRCRPWGTSTTARQKNAMAISIFTRCRLSSSTPPRSSTRMTTNPIAPANRYMEELAGAAATAVDRAERSRGAVDHHGAECQQAQRRCRQYPVLEGWRHPARMTTPASALGSRVPGHPDVVRRCATKPASAAVRRREATLGLMLDLVDVKPIAPQAAATIQKRSMIFVSDQASSSK